ncbi:hypothetical protein LIER_27877 [Lithospermum erythrorhizon]|uniref:Uncharacterized protein n=1 Tax=Lithospermum erythrorhizon TaxID=34254 RepID=A0AAV3RF57_LITER
MNSGSTVRELTNQNVFYHAQVALFVGLIENHTRFPFMSINRTKIISIRAIVPHQSRRRGRTDSQCGIRRLLRRRDSAVYSNMYGNNRGGGFGNIELGRIGRRPMQLRMNGMRFFISAAYTYVDGEIGGRRLKAVRIG